MAATHQSNLRFVKLVEQHPCIYDTTREEYNIRSKVDEAWNRIATMMGEDIYSVKRRWRCLRTVYKRQHERERAGIALRPYYLADAMSFVAPFIKDRNATVWASRPNIDDIPQYEEEEEEEISGEMSYFDDGSGTEDVSQGEKPQSSNNSNVVMIKQEGEQFKEDPLPSRSSTGSGECHNYSQQQAQHTSQHQPPQPQPNQTHSVKPTSRRTAIYNDARTAAYSPYPQYSYLEEQPPVKRTKHEFDPDEQFLLSIKPEMSGMNLAQKLRFKRGVYELLESILTADNRDSGPKAASTSM